MTALEEFKSLKEKQIQDGQPFGSAKSASPERRIAELE